MINPKENNAFEKLRLWSWNSFIPKIPKADISLVEKIQDR